MTQARDFDDPPLPHYMQGMSCGCFGLMRCERHQQMCQSLAQRYGSSARSSTACENAANPSSSSNDGTAASASGIDGPR